MDFALRPAVLTDADALGAVHIACWHETYPHLLSPASFAIATPEWRATRWRRYLPDEPGPSSNGGVTWLAESGGELLGFAGAGEIEGGILQLHAIYVLRKAHGTGVGQALLDRALDGNAAELWVAEENPRARRFYERNGFALTGVRKVEPFILDQIAELRMARPQG